MSRETELRTAITAAALPPRDFKIFAVLLDRAQWGSAEILPRFAPRSLIELAQWCGMPKSVLAVGLNHLEAHKWIERNRWRTPGRGHSTRYKLTLGGDCDCRPADRPEPLSEAERARRYRARKKASGSAVTQGEKASGESVTPPPGKESGIHVTEPPKRSGIHVTKGPASRDDTAGQGPVSAKRVSDEGSSKGRDVSCDVCGTPMDPVLLAIGERAHPMCDPGEVLPGEPVLPDFARTVA